ncbi:MAG TPA: glycosyltransferase family 4 protein [Chitinophagales bacterium]|nr:glycosyltransferase family 4 protein [Chitinophagales bacterium]
MQENRKIKISYVLFELNKALAFEWIADNIDKEKFEVSFISIHVAEHSYFELFCKQRNIEFHRVVYDTKKNLLSAILHTYKLLKRIKPDIVHTHIFEGSLIGLTAAFLAGIKNRIQTRHHSSFHHIHAPGGVKFDKYCNRISTTIIAPSENVKEILLSKEQVPESKISLIHHGFDLSHFMNISDDRLTVVKNKYNPKDRHPVIGVVSRYTALKGIPYILNAFELLLKEYPTAYLILANAKGEDKASIQASLSSIPVDAYKEIEFEQDNGALFKLFDIFVHVPISKDSEAFGQTYIEALSVGVPCIFTLSGVANEFIADRRNALVVDYKNAGQINESMKYLLINKEFSTMLTENGRNDVEKYFSLPLMIAKLEQLYSRQG